MQAYPRLSDYAANRPIYVVMKNVDIKTSICSTIKVDKLEKQDYVTASIS